MSCPDCGDLAVPVDRIVVIRDDEAGHSFHFWCDGCRNDVDKAAPGRVADVLLAAGARRAGVEQIGPPPFTAADLDALRADLDAEDWQDRLLRP